ncbi:MAG: alkaline phosphatase family protein [Phycisphaerales bacterium]|nr:MAG: alkaline phosphatase family protein [Phycisphaerales bacterium]
MAKNTRPRVRPGLALVALSAAVFLTGWGASGCDDAPSQPGRPDRTAAGRHPILLIGLDGVEWDVVLPMLRQGRLPNIARLMEQGFFGRMSTTRPTLSPVIWTSIATGKSARQHGIRGFIHKAPNDPEYQRLYTNSDRRTKAFWNILSEEGLRVHVVGWWMTFPVEKINGVMVAQVNTSTPQRNQAGTGIWKGSLVEGLSGQVYPPERQDEFLAVVPEVEAEMPELARRVFGTFSGPLSPVGAKLWGACDWTFRADAIYRRIALRLLKEDADYDVLAVYFGGTDVMGHRFWRFMLPDRFEMKPTPQELQDLGDVVWDYYAYMDSVVGELLAAAPADSVVFLVSDHGMIPINRKAQFDPEMPAKALNSGGHPNAPDAFFVACGPGIRKSGMAKPLGELTRGDLPYVGTIFDMTPTILHLLNLSVGRDMDGGVMKEIVEPEFLARNPIRMVLTHTPPDWFESRPALVEGAADTEERLEQLRMLGYIDGPGDEDKPKDYEGPADSDYDEYSG